MSYTQILAVALGRRPAVLAEFQNSHGWAPSVWRRMLLHRGYDENWMQNDSGLVALWRSIERLPAWQQVPLVLTFDTGVIPGEEARWAADQLDEFERNLPAPEGHANHVPKLAEVLRSGPETPLIGVWATSVTENPFDPWNVEADEPGSGISLDEMYVLERHRAITLC